MTECQICGAVIKDDMQFCIKCTIERVHAQALKINPVINPGQGENSEGVVCFVCGERLGPNSKKCGKCGIPDQDHAMALKWFLKSAKDGDAGAQQRLGDIYFKGIGIDRDYKKAFKWYYKSVEQGNDTSKAQLGYMYEQSLGVDQDYQKAIELYRESAEAGNALGQARLGDMYYRGIGVEKDYKKALAYFQESAVQDNEYSQAKLGDMYLYGFGVKADYRQALKSYQESAEQGNGHSQAQLGGMYLFGVVVERDYQKALEWNQKAAEQGNDEAQANLGRMYEKGLGVDKDFRKALELYKKSAEQGNARGQARLGDIYLKGLGVERDLQKAFKCFQKSAAQDNNLAQLRLGTMYCEGNGVEQDFKKGIEWNQKSAKQGNAEAQLILAEMYRDGKGVQQDDKQAFAWMQRSAKQGNMVAQYNLGCSYERGSEVGRDLQKAREWYLEAAEKGFDAAQLCLGNIYRGGLGVEENINEAKKWYIKAAEKGNEKAKAELLRIELEADPKKKFKNKIIASYKGDSKAMAEVANMYLMGIGVEKNEENAMEWFRKAIDYGNVSVRGQLRQAQQLINARRRAEKKISEKTVQAIVPLQKAENKIPEKTGQAAVPFPSVPKKKSPAVRTWFKKAFDYGNVSVRGKLQQARQLINARRKAEDKIPEGTGQMAVPLQRVPEKKSPAARTLFFLIPTILIIGLTLAIIYFNTIKKSGSLDNESLPVVPKIAAVPPPKTEPIPLAILETIPETAEKISTHKSAPKQNDKKSLKIAETDHAPIKIEPVAAVLRREYKSLNEQEISEMLVAKNIFDAARNSSRNFRHQYEVKNVAGVGVIFDRATKLVWMRPKNLVKMNLQKTRDWIGSLNNLGYGGISNWRLPTVEEAAALLEKNPHDEKIFLDAVFGKDVKSIWTGDSFTESRSWIIDFRNGLVDYAKNKSSLPALIVSSDLNSISN